MSVIKKVISFVTTLIDRIYPEGVDWIGSFFNCFFSPHS